MLFKELSQGYRIFLFDRASVEALEGEIIKVGTPYYDSNQPIGSSVGMVLDVTASINGSPIVYTLRADAETAYDTKNNILVSTTREGVIRDVESMRSHKRESISHYEKDKADLVKLESILESYDPSAKKMQQTEERLKVLENNVGSIKDMIELMLNKRNKNGQETTD